MAPKTQSFTKDHVSRLVYMCQRERVAMPVYSEFESSGQPHAPLFCTSVTVSGKLYRGQTPQASKMLAKHEAARVALIGLGWDTVETDSKSTTKIESPVAPSLAPSSDTSPTSAAIDRLHELARASRAKLTDVYTTSSSGDFRCYFMWNDTRLPMSDGFQKKKEAKMKAAQLALDRLSYDLKNADEGRRSFETPHRRHSKINSPHEANRDSQADWFLPLSSRFSGFDRPGHPYAIPQAQLHTYKRMHSINRESFNRQNEFRDQNTTSERGNAQIPSQQIQINNTLQTKPPAESIPKNEANSSSTNQLDVPKKRKCFEIDAPLDSEQLNDIKIWDKDLAKFANDMLKPTKDVTKCTRNILLSICNALVSFIPLGIECIIVNGSFGRDMSTTIDNVVELVLFRTNTVEARSPLKTDEAMQEHPKASESATAVYMDQPSSEMLNVQLGCAPQNESAKNSLIPSENSPLSSLVNENMRFSDIAAQKDSDQPFHSNQSDRITLTPPPENVEDPKFFFAKRIDDALRASSVANCIHKVSIPPSNESDSTSQMLAVVVSYVGIQPLKIRLVVAADVPKSLNFESQDLDAGQRSRVNELMRHAIAIEKLRELSFNGESVISRETLDTWSDSFCRESLRFFKSRHSLSGVPSTVSRILKFWAISLGLEDEVFESVSNLFDYIAIWSFDSVERLLNFEVSNVSTYACLEFAMKCLKNWKLLKIFWTEIQSSRWRSLQPLMLDPVNPLNNLFETVHVDVLSRIGDYAELTLAKHLEKETNGPSDFVAEVLRPFASSLIVLSSFNNLFRAVRFHARDDVNFEPGEILDENAAPALQYVSRVMRLMQAHMAYQMHLLINSLTPAMPVSGAVGGIKHADIVKVAESVVDAVRQCVSIDETGEGTWDEVIGTLISAPVLRSVMFRNTFQSGFLSILYSIGSKPLQIWDKKVRNGHIKRITDNDIQSSVLEIIGTNVSTNYITCPSQQNRTLGIKLPFLVMIIKNLKKYFTFEVQVLDDKNVRRRFRASNYQSTTRVKPFICTMPMRLDDGWNQIQFNLSDFTRRAYGTNYIETLRVQIHANCRIRRIYFSDRLYSEEELPPEFKLFLPIQKQG
ncbi:hypothetical protein HDU83_001196 [Entophlyctis luteolus]|nr:hypothetical protein HDU83_001196 [Entophlyctis luteolus]